MPLNTITPRAQSDDGRSFVIGPITIPDPTDGIVVELALAAEWEFELLRLRARVDVGSAAVRITNDGAAVRWVGDDSTNGSVILIAGPTETHEISSNGLVLIEKQLTLLVEALSSAPQDLFVQLLCRRTQKNV